MGTGQHGHRLPGTRLARQFKDGFVHHTYLSEQTASHMAIEMHDEIRQMLRTRGITRLFSHQAQAWSHLRRGSHVAVATPTASGKTFIFLLYIFERLLRNHHDRSLLIYPYKALGQDQRKIIEELTLQLFPVTMECTASLF